MVLMRKDGEGSRRIDGEGGVVRHVLHQPGLGLGLALTRALARAQGGDVTLANHDGPGADFRVTFPAAAASGLG